MKPAIIFDLDGTLLDRDASLVLFITSQFSRFETVFWDVNFEAYLSRFLELDSRGMVWKDIVYQALILEFNLTTISWETLLDDYISRFCESCVTFPGVLKTLSHLHKCGYPMGLITNGRYPFQLKNIRALHLEKFFQIILISEQEGIQKPNPEIFHRATKQLGVNNSDAYYIGDHPTTDIKGAQVAGLKGIWKKNSQWDCCLHADGVFENFDESLYSQLRH